MTNRVILVLVAAILCGVGALTPNSTVRAAAIPIKIGDEFTGQFAPGKQLSFTFNAKKDIPLLVEFRVDKGSSPRPPVFRVRIDAADVLNSFGIAYPVAEGFFAVPKDGDYVLDVLPPPGDELATIFGRVLAPSILNNGAPVTGQYAPDPVWYYLVSNGQFTLTYSSADPNGMRPLILSGVIPSGLKLTDTIQINSGYLKPILSTDNSVGGDPDFGATNNVTLTFNPKPAVAIYLVRLGGGKRPVTQAFTLLRADAKK